MLDRIHWLAASRRKPNGRFSSFWVQLDYFSDEQPLPNDRAPGALELGVWMLRGGGLTPARDGGDKDPAKAGSVT
jgi:hypothetical protein